MTVTATVSTKDRYFTTLPLTLNGILAQTVLPEHFILFDDGEHKDLRNISPYNHLFRMLDLKGIKWKVVFGARKGQILNHQMALEMAETNFIWRIDDDEVPAPNCLENLITIIKDPSVGAVGGLVLAPNSAGPRPSFVSTKIEDILSGFNVQWYRWGGEPEEVDHLYSSFLYRKEAGQKAGGYNKNLSPVGHREETMFSHQIKRAGYKLIITPYSLTWHLREDTGGIRSYKDASLWTHDEQIFAAKLKEWGVVPREHKFVVLDNGIGDHIVFRSILPEIKQKNLNARIIIACCYPEVFEKDNVILASIADAKAAFNNLDKWDIYKFCTDKNLSGPLVDAFKMMYL
jgi:hypothetical protein